jgi:hypothetical protein
MDTQGKQALSPFICGKIEGIAAPDKQKAVLVLGNIIQQPIKVTNISELGGSL